jgi:2-polyprenyl-3-methyl-5-hydroxy-6-metoxy-1,4-benzoquinol methylase
VDWKKIMNCPLCSSSKTKVLLAADWKKTVAHLVHGSKETKPTIIKACKICTNAWTLPPPSLVDYQRADFHTNASNSEDHEILRTVHNLPRQWKHSVLMQAQLLARYLPPRAKILEIGCGEGILLDELSRLGFSVKGIEPSLMGSARARRKGIDCLTGYFPHPDIQEPFDAVILSHVLEHLEKPLEVLNQVSAIAPQGIVLLVQTNYKGILPQLLRWRWYAWACMEHYWHFTPQGLAYITQSLNLNFIACEFSSLVHEDNYLTRLVEKRASAFPEVYDQFHLLLKISKPI